MSDHRLFIAAALAAATAPSLACSDINTPIYFNGPGPSNMMPLLETCPDSECLVGRRNLNVLSRKERLELLLERRHARVDDDVVL